MSRHIIRCGLGFILSVTGLSTAVAQTPPAGAVARVSTEAPANRVTLSVDQVRALMVAHHRDVAAGTSEDNTVTIVLSSAGEYVASGSSKMLSVALRAAPTGAGGVVAAGAGGSTAGAVVSAGAGGGGRAVAIARTGQADVVALPATAQADGAARMINFAGVGEVDARLIQDMYFQSYEPGDVSMNAIRIRFVVLTGRLMKF